MEAPSGSATTAAAFLSASFAGAAVRRVDVPAPDLVVLTVHHERRDHVLVLCAGDGASGLGLVEKRPIAAPAGAFAGLLRKHLEGGRIVDVEARSESTLGFVLRRGDATCELVLEVARRASLILLLDGASRALGAAPPIVVAARQIVPGQHYTAPSRIGSAVEWPSTREELSIAGRSLLDARRTRNDQSMETAAERALRRERARLQRRAKAIESDLAKSEASAELRLDATAVLAALATIPPRAQAVVLENPATGEPRRITLDPALSAAAHANKLFTRARKLDRGRVIATARQAEALAGIDAIDQALAALARGDLGPAERLVGARATTERAPTRAVGEKTGASREPFRRYRSRDGTEILVGRSARDNDRLTFTHGRPHDLWLHARGRTGSHVIVRVDPPSKPTEETIEDAALLAAHFSAARGDTAADVLCVERRLLRKPRRGAPGAVLAEGAATVRVRLSTERVAELLATLVA